MAYRGILFRGKRIDNDKWIEGNLVVCAGKYFIYVLIVNELVGFEVYSNTIGQWTGLTDKNGKKIFEGDIMNFVNKAVVRWHKVFGAFVMYDPPHNGVQWAIFDCGICPYEVIGNIHDTPELIGREG